MAVLKQGALGGGLNGRIGNLVYVETPGGTVVRSRPSYVPRATAKQLEARQRMGRASSAFGRLSPA